MQLQQPHCQKERYSRRWLGSVGHSQLTELGDLPDVLYLCSNLKTVPKEYKSWRTLKTFFNLEALVPNYDCFCNSNTKGLNLMIICKIILTTDPDFYYPFSLPFKLQRAACRISIHIFHPIQQNFLHTKHILFCSTVSNIFLFPSPALTYTQFHQKFFFLAFHQLAEAREGLHKG